MFRKNKQKFLKCFYVLFCMENENIDVKEAKQLEVIAREIAKYPKDKEIREKGMDIGIDSLGICTEKKHYDKKYIIERLKEYETN